MTDEESSKTTFAPRLHVLLARNAPVGLVIRRGPSKQVATVGWDRRTDEFQLGQWFKGRIYERRCDLSPDGKHFIYCALKGKETDDTSGSWTAISRAPYLKAVELFPMLGTWFGGGLWTGVDSYWLNLGGDPANWSDRGLLRRDFGFRPDWNISDECLSVYFPRLIRDGWRRVEIGADVHMATFEKPASAGWTLRRIAHNGGPAIQGKGCYSDEHLLFHSANQAALMQPDWEWADLDGDRLVWATGGKLFVARMSAAGPTDEKLLYDFGNMTFEPIKAPY